MRKRYDTMRRKTAKLLSGHTQLLYVLYCTVVDELYMTQLYDEQQKNIKKKGRVYLKL